MDNQYFDPVPQKQSNGLGVASFVCGIISFGCFNPAYLVSIAAIVLGIVGLCGANKPKGLATAGLILGCVAILVGVIVDICLIPLTFGASFCF